MDFLMFINVGDLLLTNFTSGPNLLVNSFLMSYQVSIFWKVCSTNITFTISANIKIAVSSPSVLINIIILLVTVLTLHLLCFARFQNLVDDSHMLIDVGIFFTTQLTQSSVFKVNHFIMHIVIGCLVCGVATKITFVINWRFDISLRFIFWAIWLWMI